jgi:hypothetical protein
VAHQAHTMAAEVAVVVALLSAQTVLAQQVAMAAQG